MCARVSDDFFGKKSWSFFGLTSLSRACLIMCVCVCVCSCACVCVRVSGVCVFADFLGQEIVELLRSHIAESGVFRCLCLRLCAHVGARVRVFCACVCVRGLCLCVRVRVRVPV